LEKLPKVSASEQTPATRAIATHLIRVTHTNTSARPAHTAPAHILPTPIWFFLRRGPSFLAVDPSIFGLACEEVIYGRGNSGAYPEHCSTGSAGYFGNAGSVAESSHRRNVAPRSDSIRRA